MVFPVTLLFILINGQSGYFHNITGNITTKGRLTGYGKILFPFPKNFPMHKGL